jgi:DNA-binding CsgD family transcriptional regulator
MLQQYMAMSLSLLSALCFHAVLKGEYAKRWFFVLSKAVKAKRSISIKTSINVGFVGVVQSLAYYSITHYVPAEKSIASISILALVFIVVAGVLFWDIFCLKNLIEFSSPSFFVPLAITGVLPMLNLNDTGRYICGLYLLVVTVLYGLLIAMTVAELIRFNQLSSIRAFGFCGFHLFIGTTVGWAAYSLNELIYLISWQWITIVAVWFLAIAGFFLFEPNKEYPIWNNEFFENSKSTSIQKAGWREKVEKVAKERELSSRQTELLFLLAKGRNVNYLMKEFYIAKGTAKTHISNIYKKLGVHSQQELMDLFDKKQ